MEIARRKLSYWKDSGRLICIADKSQLTTVEAQQMISHTLGDSQTHITDSLDNLDPAASIIYMASSADWSELNGTSLVPPVNRLEVDLAKLQTNLERLSQRSPGEVVAMVKANAYGHGMVEVARFVDTIPAVSHLGVATIQEGLTLKRGGVSTEVLVTYPTVAEVPQLYKEELTIAVGSLELLQALIETGLSVTVHLDIDTGFHRSGFSHGELLHVKELLSGSNLNLAGVMTHLSCADEEGKESLNRSQVERFQKASDFFDGDILRHIGNTAASLLWNEGGWSPIRPGIGIYGLHPSRLTENHIELEPVAKLRSEIIQVIDVPGGEPVGYGATWTAPAAGARIGLVPNGYGDGIPRSLSNNLVVQVGKDNVELVGRVSMDSFTLNITNHPELGIGDAVTVYSDETATLNSVDSIAQACGTINYEVATHLAERLCRTYSF